MVGHSTLHGLTEIVNGKLVVTGGRLGDRPLSRRHSGDDVHIHTPPLGLVGRLPPPAPHGTLSSVWFV